MQLNEVRKATSSEVKSEVFYQLVLLLLGLLVIGLIILVKSETAYDFASQPLLFTYTIFITSFQLSRVLGAMFYKNVYSQITADISVAKDKLYTPKVSFVIPCKNEEASIAKTVHKSFQANYPKELLEVIVINDGSTDKTGEILDSLKPMYPNLTVVHWAVNRGKRHGMAYGFRIAKGEIIIQLDSDSYIEPMTFREFIRPFQHPDIGAVSAHSLPENSDKNMLTRMQAAYYFVSFRILKAAESAFLTVFCCSGCASAYRKNLILPILDKWLDEKFMGKPITWGDDRALTNWILRQNYKTVYTDDVQAYTIVPEKFGQFLKQQVRWKKGWFVNSIFALKFIFKKQPFVAVTYFLPLFLLTLATPVMATKAFIINPLFNHTSPLYYIVGVLLVSCIVTIYYRSVSREDKYWPYVFVWSGLNMVILSFILYYALFNLSDRKWGTR